MRRRQYLQLLSAAAFSGALTGNAVGESDSPTVSNGILDAHSWEEGETPPDPDFQDSDYQDLWDRTTWNLSSFRGTELPQALEEETDLENVLPLKQLWAAEVTTGDQDLKDKWRSGESYESVLKIDAATEVAFEDYVTQEILGGELEKRGEVHKKAAKQTTTGILGVVPIVGDFLSQGADWVWDMQTSVSTSTGDTAHISQYYFSLPFSAIAENTGEVFDDDGSFDYRGIYIDWMTDNDTFYASGAIYPEDEEHLNSRLSDAIDEGLWDFGWKTTDYVDTGGGYEREIIDLLRNLN